MPALVAGIHVFRCFKVKTWMAGTSPAMTNIFAGRQTFYQAQKGALTQKISSL
jgi:hypothetical protein